MAGCKDYQYVAKAETLRFRVPTRNKFGERVYECTCLIQSLRSTVQDCCRIQCRQGIEEHYSMGDNHMSALHDMHTRYLAADVTSS